MSYRVTMDFETRSAEPIKNGIYRYTAHETFRILCMAWAVEEGPIELWLPGDDLPSWLYDPEAELHAHNAMFERLVARSQVDWPRIDISRWRCSAAMAAAAGMPRALDKVGAALDLPIQKDKRGRQLISKLCIPRKPTLRDPSRWCDDSKLLQELYDYCRRDVEVERLLWHRLPHLTEKEQKVWELDQTINDRGAYVDLPLVAKIERLYASHQRTMETRLRKLTKGYVASGSQVAKMKEWLENEGVYTRTLSADTVSRLLDDKTISCEASSLLQLRSELAKSSVAKFTAFTRQACADNRLRGMTRYYGAHTGRWSGVGVQLQNLPRGVVKGDWIDSAIRTIDHGTEAVALFGPVANVLSSLVRSIITASPGHELFVFDFAAIEARCLAWMSGQADLLEQFHQGADTYITLAAEIYGIDTSQVTKEQRQVGKIARLGLGYGMGAARFQETAAKYGIVLDAKFCEQVVATYRKLSPSVVNWWYDLEKGAIWSIKKQKPAKVNGVRWRVERDWLCCDLISKRTIRYYRPRVVREDGRERIKHLHENSLSKKWCETSPYYGIFAENVIQGVCRDVLAECLARFEQTIYKPIVHVHDEVVTEAPKGLGSLEEVIEIATIVPSWAKGFPIGSSGFKAQRYRKD